MSNSKGYTLIYLFVRASELRLHFNRLREWSSKLHLPNIAPTISSGISTFFESFGPRSPEVGLLLSKPPRAWLPPTTAAAAETIPRLDPGPTCPRCDCCCDAAAAVPRTDAKVFPPATKACRLAALWLLLKISVHVMLGFGQQQKQFSINDIVSIRGHG